MKLTLEIDCDYAWFRDGEDPKRVDCMALAHTIRKVADNIDGCLLNEGMMMTGAVRDGVGNKCGVWTLKNGRK